MNSKAVTLLSCGGGGAEWDEDEVLDGALTELSSALADGTVADAVADPLDLELPPLFGNTNYITTQQSVIIYLVLIPLSKGYVFVQVRLFVGTAQSLYEISQDFLEGRGLGK